MEDTRLQEYRQARLREQEEERRARKVASDLRLQKELQAQDEARQAETPPVEERHYAQLPRHSHTGIR